MLVVWRRERIKMSKPCARQAFAYCGKLLCFLIVEHHPATHTLSVYIHYIGWIKATETILRTQQYPCLAPIGPCRVRGHEHEGSTIRDAVTMGRASSDTMMMVVSSSGQLDEQSIPRTSAKEHIGGSFETSKLLRSNYSRSKSHLRGLCSPARPWPL